MTTKGLTAKKVRSVAVITAILLFVAAAMFVVHIVRAGNTPIIEYPTTGNTPRGLTFGSDGNVWVAEYGSNSIAKMDPTTGAVLNRYTVPTSGSGPREIVSGPDGQLYFVEDAGRKVGAVSTSGVFTECPIPDANMAAPNTAFSSPNDLAFDDNGMLWVVVRGGSPTYSSKIFKYDYTQPCASAFTEYNLDTIYTTLQATQPVEITKGGDGRMWVTAASSGTGPNVPSYVLAFTTSATPVWSSYQLASNKIIPFGIAAGADGSIWVSSQGYSSFPTRVFMIRLQTDGTVTSTIQLPGQNPTTDVRHMAIDGYGNAWFADYGRKTFGYADPITGTLIDVATLSGAWNIINKPGNMNELWFSEDLGKKIGTLTSDFTAPDPPVITTPSGTTANRRPTIAGTGEVGATVTVKAGVAPICTSIVAADGTWSCTPASDLALGAYTFTATQTDTASNTSLTSNSITITIRDEFISIGVVDGSGGSVTNPNFTFGNTTIQPTCHTTYGTLGTVAQKIRVTNITNSGKWTVSMAATNGNAAVWSNGTNSYSYNVPNSLGDCTNGQLTVDPSSLTVAPQVGCNATGISPGSSSAYTTVNSAITLFSADTTAMTDCFWDMTNIGLTQTVPAMQPAGTYTIDMTLTILAQ